MPSSKGKDLDETHNFCEGWLNTRVCKEEGWSIFFPEIYQKYVYHHSISFTYVQHMKNVHFLQWKRKKSQRTECQSTSSRCVRPWSDFEALEQQPRFFSEMTVSWRWKKLKKSRSAISQFGFWSWLEPSTKDVFQLLVAFFTVLLELMVKSGSWGLVYGVLGKQHFPALVAHSLVYHSRPHRRRCDVKVWESVAGGVRGVSIWKYVLATISMTIFLCLLWQIDTSSA